MIQMAKMENSIFSVYERKPKHMDVDAQSTEAQTKVRSESNLKEEDVDDDGFCIV